MPIWARPVRPARYSIWPHSTPASPWAAGRCVDVIGDRIAACARRESAPCPSGRWAGGTSRGALADEGRHEGGHHHAAIALHAVEHVVGHVARMVAEAKALECENTMRRARDVEHLHASRRGETCARSRSCRAGSIRARRPAERGEAAMARRVGGVNPPNRACRCGRASSAARRRRYTRAAATGCSRGRRRPRWR